MRERSEPTAMSRVHGRGAKLHNSRPNSHSIELASSLSGKMKRVSRMIYARDTSQAAAAVAGVMMSAFNDFPWIFWWLANVTISRRDRPI